MKDLFRKQLLGMAGAAPAILIAVPSWVYAPRRLPHIQLLSNDSAGRLAYAVRWLLIPGVSLLAGIFGASRRGFYAGAIEGTRLPTNHSLEINLWYNQNTLEQTLLAAIAWMGLALALPYDDLARIPMMALLFAIGRVAFWVGYLLHPMARAFGMTLTVVPTILAFAWLIASMFG